ncbi:TPA: tRNA 2-thiouridine(34) synthase MnmA [Candidatus Uhrbacteria bacterium]|nr:tRNA 2-thiouridine(34) synthase MnmA [Candidatus Uhrbacteria bacterium]
MLKKKVLLGMSGGVDSSVSAALLLENGYEVIGAFMKNWSGSVCGPRQTDEDDVGEMFQECGWKDERRDAARVAAKLNIPFVTFDFEKEYRRDVVEYLFREFETGRTPNPDVMCNKYIKFDRFIQEADRLGCEYVATGHYAREQNGLLYKAVDSNKDQTYFLWAINPKIVSRILFPIGEMTKPEVRKKAEEFGLEVAHKKDSTGICFVGEVDIRTFLQKRLPKDPGNVVTIEGDMIGTHEGVSFYTIGQRHGLSIGGGQPYYVVDKRPETKELVVSSNFHPALFKTRLTATQLNWFEKPVSPFACLARIRHRQPLQPCRIQLVSIDGIEKVSVAFDEHQRAITPGQSIVFYDVDKVLGGGIIE